MLGNEFILSGLGMVCFNHIIWSYVTEIGVILAPEPMKATMKSMGK